MSGMRNTVVFSNEHPIMTNNQKITKQSARNRAVWDGTSWDMSPSVIFVMKSIKF